MEVNTIAQSPAATALWKKWIPLLLIGLLPILFAPSFSSLFYKWTQWSEGLSHGLLLIAIFLYLTYDELPFSYIQSNKIIVTVIGLTLAGVSLCWALFALIDLNLLAELSLLAVLFTAIAYLYGPSSAWQQRFLLAIPIFAITLWDQLNGGLVNLSGFVVGELVKMLNVPAVIDGNSIFIPYGHIVIADGCSGLRYLIIALAMGYLVSYFNGYKEKQLLPVLLMAATLALFTNWIRIFVLILVGFYTEMQSPLMNDHDFFGWLLFAGICLPALYFAPVSKKQPKTLEDKAQPTSKRILTALLLLSIGPLAYLLAPNPNSDQPVSTTLSAAYKPTIIQSNNEKGTSIGSLQEIPFEWQQSFIRESAQITISNYRRDRKGEKLVPYLANLYQTDSWTKSTVNNPGFVIEGATAILQKKGQAEKIAQIQWFQIGNFYSGSARAIKLLQIPALLFGEDIFRVITLTQACTPQGCTNAIESLSNMAADIRATIKD